MSITLAKKKDVFIYFGNRIYIYIDKLYAEPGMYNTMHGVVLSLCIYVYH